MCTSDPETTPPSHLGSRDLQMVSPNSIPSGGEHTLYKYYTTTSLHAQEYVYYLYARMYIVRDTTSREYAYTLHAVCTTSSRHHVEWIPTSEEML